MNKIAPSFTFTERHCEWILITNASMNVVQVSATEGLHSRGVVDPSSHVDLGPGQNTRLPRNDWELVFLRSKTNNQLGQPSTFYVPNGAHVLYQGDSDELPKGVSRDHNLDQVGWICNKNGHELRFATLKQPTVWTPLQPGLSASFENAQLVLIRYHDGGRVALQVEPATCVYVGPHHDPIPPANQTSPVPARHFTVLSYNIRYGSASDQLNSWTYRRDAHFRVYETSAPTIFGLQEALAFQCNEIAQRFPWLRYIGTGREHDSTGESTPIFYDARVYTLVHSETFWLSDTPDVPGSVGHGWGNNLPRIATLAHLVSTTRQEGLPNILVVNTHLDHESRVARVRGVQVVCERMLSYKAKAEVSSDTLEILMGDFNCDAVGSQEVRVVGVATKLIDVHPNEASTGTFHGFYGREGGGIKIDFIFASASWENRIVKTNILRDGIEGRNGWFPSDHFSVSVSFSLDSI
ncbi:Endonuclease/exonuclease/phosphatase [Chytriomyces sp. MP71]|nr:Endonuclease/exonuclease/phosphatase [Chytriomyces sp. MP71]